MAGKFVEGLLSQAERKSHWIAEEPGFRADLTAVRVARVRRHDIRGHAIVSVEIASRRPGARGGKQPVLLDPCIDAKAWTKSLGKRVIVAFDPPGAQKLRHCRCLDTGTERVLQSRIGNRLDSTRTPTVRRASLVRCTRSAMRSCSTAARRENDCPGKVARVQILLGKWTRFPNQIAGKRKPVFDRSAGHINKLAKYILIHEPGGKGVATDGVLDSGHEVSFTPPT